MYSIIPVNRKHFPIALFLSFIGTVLVFILLKYLLDRNLMPYGSLNWLFLGGPLYYFIISLAQCVKTLFDKNACLRITGEGIDDHLSIFSCGKVSWREIEGIPLRRTILKTRFLSIRVTDPDRLIARQPAWKKHMLKKYLRKWGTPVIISEYRITTGLDQLLRTLAAHTGLAPYAPESR